MPVHPKVLRRAIEKGELCVIRLEGQERWRRLDWGEVCRWVRAHQARPTVHAEARVAEVLEREGAAEPPPPRALEAHASHCAGLGAGTQWRGEKRRT